MSPEQVESASFDVLFIDDVCSFLTPSLVNRVHRSGSAVVGVFAPEDGSDAKRRLLDCGISDVLEADATPIEFVEKVGTASAVAATPTPDPLPRANAYRIGVVGCVDGVGATETAIALAMSVSASLATVLVDLDATWPSVAQRLDLPVHPNIRTALDASVHHTGTVENSLLHIGDLAVVAGIADGGSGSSFSYPETSALFEDLAVLSDCAVADFGAFDRADRQMLRSMDTVMVVGNGDPVGVGRILRTLERVSAVVGAGSILVVVNKVGRSAFVSSEIRAEIEGADESVPVVALPFDKRIAEAAWEGAPLGRGSFRKAVRRMGRLVTGEVAR